MAAPIVAAAGAAAKAIAKKMATKAVKGAAKKAVSGGDDDNNKTWIVVTAAVVVVILILSLALMSATLRGVLSLLPTGNVDPNECYVMSAGDYALLSDNGEIISDFHSPSYDQERPGGGSGGSAGSPGGRRIGLAGIGNWRDDVPEYTGRMIFPMEHHPGYPKPSPSLPGGAYGAPRPGTYTGVHLGMDWSNGSNGVTKIFAPADGIVVGTRYSAASGNEVYVQYNIKGGNYISRIPHMSNPHNQYVKEGDFVTAGTVLGLVGNTGSYSQGAHLHFEIWQDRINNGVHPVSWLNMNGPPIELGGPLPGGPLADNLVTLPGAGGGTAIGSGGVVPANSIDPTTSIQVCQTQDGDFAATPLGGTSFNSIYPNGEFPPEALCSPDFNSVHKLDCNAAPALNELNRAYKARFGSDIAITDSYRSYEAQVRCYNDPAKARPGGGSMCATPGTSNHGYGRAVDLGGGINSFGTPQHQWMRENAEKYGWTLPSWARENGSKPEPWHWEYTGMGNNGNGRTPEGAKMIARSEMGRYGWGEDQFRCLNNLWERESNWRYDAENPSSGAYGIPQSLPGNKMATVGLDWRTNPTTQIKWGLQYIQGRYGNPCGAWSHSEARGWY